MQDMLRVDRIRNPSIKAESRHNDHGDCKNHNNADHPTHRMEPAIKENITINLCCLQQRNE